MVLQGILGSVLALTERICAKLNLEPDGDFEGPLKLPEEVQGILTTSTNCCPTRTQELT